ncbi:amidophosphoribosyltransferase [Kiritimatiella glycovorans]|uniref:Amidophosphoribosyltransferase n=1 Tax=Kiritimatiella glycovorans TaxID=1307763 RepID=A0A0G3EIP7_9BACT|nr:amidophosphoribosyltransferase [Kiritimatiella glycovorans]AKJ64029.1 Amidophosphoribosyltransferase precursor [Kiritimatiella glycovorans]
MSGFFGVTSKHECVRDVFFGTDYHSHLGTLRGGMAVSNHAGLVHSIHDITNSPFRSKFDHELAELEGRSAIGVISDFEDQPLIIGSHLGNYAIATVGAVCNIDELRREAMDRGTHFSEMSGQHINPTEIIAMLINRGATFAEGLRHAQERVEGSASILLLTRDALYAARDRLGRTPVILGARKDTMAVTLETCAFPNLGFETVRDLGPGEVVRCTPEGAETLMPPGDREQICTFLWVYYGYPASSYAGINVEQTRYRCGRALARRDDADIDSVCGIPDSGTGHAVGYSNQSGTPYSRPFVKYTPTWPRSFMPQDQQVRDLVARMKLIPIRSLIENRRLLFCEDSIVRGTQLQDTLARLYSDYGARELHMRAACPPLLFGCPYLNFSRSKPELDLATRKAMIELEGREDGDPSAYVDPDGEAHRAMIDTIRRRLNLTSLRYQRLEDLVEAVGLPRERLCTYCWTGD